MKNQRFNLFYDWLEGLDLTNEWLAENFTLGYLDGWMNGFEYFETDKELNEQVLQEYETGTVLKTPNPNLNVSLEEFRLGFQDGTECRKLFKPIEKQTQRALVWV